MDDPSHWRAPRPFNRRNMVYPITLEALSRPSLPAGGGASHVGVWEAVQRPRKAELEGWGGVRQGWRRSRLVRGWNFPERNFNYTAALARAAPSSTLFVKARQRLFVVRHIERVFVLLFVLIREPSTFLLFCRLLPFALAQTLPSVREWACRL